MAKRVFIVYGWDGYPEECWFPWLKKELEKRKFKVIIADMPGPDIPIIKKWVRALNSQVGKADKDTYFVGHSIGCQTILRYIQTLPSKSKIGGAVFVAGWFKLKNLEDEGVERIAKPWLETRIDFLNIKKKFNNIVALLSNNDPYGFETENAKIFKKDLGAKVIIVKGKGHFNDKSRTKKVPTALKELLRIVK